MSFKHIISPTKGLFTAAPPTQIEDEASPYNAGIYMRDGEVVSDYGHTTFPVPGLLKTNKVHGIFMRGDQFLTTDGINRAVVHTTTNAYQYNTSTNTWDCITKGQTIDDGESAWTPSANVTATNDTSTKLRGSKSTKLAIAAAFTTGLVGYIDIASLDLTGESAVHFWIYSSIDLASGDFKLVLDDTSGCVSVLESLTIPAISANTWTPVCLDYATPAGLGAIISVGLLAINDVGACDIYLDDIRSVDKFTGTASNRFSIDFLNNIMYITNGIDQPKKYAGTAATGEVTWTTTLATGSITTSEFVLTAKDHIVLFNNTENGADAPNRASWTNIGQGEDFVNGTAGYQDLLDDSSWIISAAQLSENAWAIYKETSIVLMEWVGGQTPFRFKTMVRNKSIAGKDCVIAIDGIHYVVGTRDVYRYAGGEETENIDIQIKRDIYGSVDYTYLLRAFLLYIEEDDELQIFLPTATQYPDKIYCYDVKLKVWYKKTRTITGKGSWNSSSSLTIGELVGTIGEQNYPYGSTIIKSNSPLFLVGDSNGSIFKLDKTTLNNAGNAITNEFQTPDFTRANLEKGVNRGSDINSLIGALSATGDPQNKTFRTKKLFFEAKGQSISVFFSIDGGLSWAPCQTANTHIVTLSAVYDIYELDLDLVVKKIRYKFLNDSVSSGYALRYYGFEYGDRSSRK